MVKKLTTEEFVHRARLVHGDKYDYSKTIYVNSNTEVVITCKRHGDFKMLPYNHVKLGCDCQECAGTLRWSNELLEKRGREKYGERFDYSMSDVNGKDGVIKIKCNVCGTVFKSTPHNHIGGLQGGCPTCRYKYVADAEKIPFNEFVRRARETHGDRYSYNKETYIDISSKTTITCKKHGDFEQYAIIHVNGCGCDYCARELVGASLMLNTDIFKQRAKEKYGDAFDLSETVYNGWDKNVTIKCNTCGESFEQKPNNFLRGFGCPNCNSSYGESTVKVFLWKYKINFTQQYAINNENVLCTNKKIYVDFYLPDQNTFIEFNGEQHYKPIEFWGGENAFEKQQIRDNALRQYCKEHKIKLIEIPYSQMSNIEDILTKELKIHKTKT